MRLTAFKGMITNGSAFDFDMKDIARIREEFATLIDRLSPKYLAIKDAEEKAAKRAKKNAVAGEKTVEKAVTVAASSTRRRRKEGVTKRLPKAPSHSGDPRESFQYQPSNTMDDEHVSI